MSETSTSSVAINSHAAVEVRLGSRVLFEDAPAYKWPRGLHSSDAAGSRHFVQRQAVDKRCRQRGEAERQDDGAQHYELVADVVLEEVHAVGHSEQEDGREPAEDNGRQPCFCAKPFEQRRTAGEYNSGSGRCDVDM